MKLSTRTRRGRNRLDEERLHARTSHKPLFVSPSSQGTVRKPPSHRERREVRPLLLRIRLDTAPAAIRRAHIVALERPPHIDRQVPYPCAQRRPPVSRRGSSQHSHKRARCRPAADRAERSVSRVPRALRLDRPPARRTPDTTRITPGRPRPAACRSLRRASVRELDLSLARFLLTPHPTPPRRPS